VTEKTQTVLSITAIALMIKSLVSALWVDVQVQVVKNIVQVQVVKNIVQALVLVLARWERGAMKTVALKAV